MSFRLEHPHHGVTFVYELPEVERHEKLGWKLAPKKPKDAEQEPETEAEQQPVRRTFKSKHAK